jgi:hypothetical protein
MLKIAVNILAHVVKDKPTEIINETKRKEIFSVYNSNGVIITNVELESICKLLKNPIINEVFQIKDFDLKLQLKKYIIYKFIANNQMEENLFAAIDNKLKEKKLSIEILKSNGILHEAIIFLLAASMLFQFQIKYFQNFTNITSPYYQLQEEIEFEKRNKDWFYTIKMTNKNLSKTFRDINFSQMSDDLQLFIKRMDKNQEKIKKYKDFTLEIVDKTYTIKKHKVYKYFHILIKDVEPEEIKSFVYSGLKSARSTMLDLQKMYHSKVVFSQERKVFSSSQDDNDLQIISALQQRSGNAFIYVGQDYITVLLLESENYTDMTLPEVELNEDAAKLLVEKVTSGILV